MIPHFPGLLGASQPPGGPAQRRRGAGGASGWRAPCVFRPMITEPRIACLSSVPRFAAECRPEKGAQGLGDDEELPFLRPPRCMESIRMTRCPPEAADSAAFGRIGR